MSFVWSDRYVEEFRRDGYVIFRGIVPPALVRDLRREAHIGRDIARRERGTLAQRLHGIGRYEELSFRPFRDYLDLPALRDAVTRVLSPHHAPGTEDILSILIEPADKPWTTGWHRDVRDTERAPEVIERFWQDCLNLDLFNQVNCALYEDSCTWVVPGSHARRDTPAEAELATRSRIPAVPIPDPTGLSNEELERVNLEYCDQFPGAKRILLDPGDYAVYRNIMWHVGNYVPYRIRATLHDMVPTQTYRDWLRWKAPFDAKWRAAAPATPN
ncbi:MAG TPA: phytanoyl-CoA dioxygenase family protein [Polyangiaceae bacterium]